MKKKIYFTISAIIQILFSIYVILNAKELSEMILESVEASYGMFPVDFQERIYSMYESAGFWLLVIPSALIIIFNIFTIKFAYDGTILKHKGSLIVFAVFGLLFGDVAFCILLSLINLIVLLASKRKNPEDFPEKRELPTVEEIEPSKFEKIAGIVLLVFYALYIVTAFINIENLPTFWLIVIQIVFYAGLFITAILAFKDRLKRDFKLLKENYKAYLSFIAPRLCLTAVMFVIANLICIFITESATSVNQSIVESMPLWFLFPMTIIWAPVVEELVFRGTFRRYLKNKTLFIIVSGILFGSIHAISEASLFTAVIVAIPYMILGGSFAYMNSKTNNVTTSMISHALWNAVAVSLSSLAMFVVL